MSKCFKCDKAIQMLQIVEAPLDATIWTSRGNFGSAVYDPGPSDSHLEICICDDCLKNSDDVIEVTVEKEVHFGRQPWRPVT